MATAVTIIVLSYNTKSVLAHCLSCLEQIRDNNQLQVIVVDNASTDDSAAMVTRQFPTVTLIQNSENVGFARANNQALSIATGEYILLLNSDAFLTAQSLSTLIDCLASNPTAGICGPILTFEDGRWQGGYGRVPSIKRELLFASGLEYLLGNLRKLQWRYARSTLPRRPFEVGFIAGACMLIRRQVIDTIGGLDESFFMYVEDAEFCYRANKMGWKVVCAPSAVVVHLGGQSGGSQNPRSELELMKAAQQNFIIRHYGEKQWQICARLRTIGFFMMYMLCWLKCAGRRQKCTKCYKFQLGIKVYASP